VSLLCALAALVLASCATLPKPGWGDAFLGDVLGEHDLYVGLEVPQNEALMRSLLAAMKMSDRSMDQMLGRLSAVYLGSDIRGGLDMVVTGDFPAVFIPAVFSKKNNWRKTTAQGTRGVYPVFRHETSHLEVFYGGKDWLLLSFDAAPMLDRLVDQRGPAGGLPPWLVEPLRRPGMRDSAHPPVQVYAPLLGVLLNNPALQALTQSGLFAAASVDIAANAVTRDGETLYSAVISLDIHNSTLKAIAQRVLALAAAPLGAKVQPGEGSRLTISDVLLPLDRVLALIQNIR
jgi:hypothetical protein